MKLQEFEDLLGLGYRVRCNNPSQRKDVLAFLDDLGYSIGPICREKYLDGDSRSWIFLYPGFDETISRISCFRTLHEEKTIEYASIQDLIEETNNEQNMSDDEFEEGIQRLFAHV